MRYLVTSAWPLRKSLRFTLMELHEALSAGQIGPNWTVRIGTSTEKASTVRDFLKDKLRGDSLRWTKNVDKEVRGWIRYRVTSLQSSIAIHAAMGQFESVPSIVQKGVDTACAVIYSLSGNWPHPFSLKIYRRDLQQRPTLLERGIANFGDWSWDKTRGWSTAELTFSTEVFRSVEARLLDRKVGEVQVEMTLLPKAQTPSQEEYTECVVEHARIETSQYV